MKDYFCSKLNCLAVPLLVLALSGLFESSALAARGRGLFRQHRHAGVRVDTQRSQQAAPQASVGSLADYCKLLKSEMRVPGPADLERSRTRLAVSCLALDRLMSRDPNREAAASWREALKLKELIATLRSRDEPNHELILAAWSEFNSDRKGVRWTVFDPVRKELRRYLTIRSLVESGKFESQFANICDNLVKYIEEYSENVDPGYGTALSDVVLWLEDISVFEPRATRLADIALANISRTNVRLRAGQEFIAAGFRSETEESMEIDETIKGTRIIGSGAIHAVSRAELLSSRRNGIIQVLVDATMTSSTTGSHPPVTFHSETNGTLRGEKQIHLSPSLISVLPARTRADLKTNLYNIRINAGPIVKCIAKGRIEQQRGSSQAEARRRAESRMNERIDQRVDPRIADLNDRYQKQLREPLQKTGLFPKIWDVSSSGQAIESSILVGDGSQPGASSAPPALPVPCDVFVQIHQSALNNAASIALSGRAFDEEKVMADLEERLDEIPEGLRREEGQRPLNVTFASKGPIAISFVGNRIKAVFRIDSFIQDGSRYPGLDITLLYDVKVVKQADGSFQVVFEQSEAPQAYPRGFDPNSDQRISARHQTIRTIVLKRLENALPKKIEGKPRELKGEWEGAGKLVPVFASSTDGWLTLSWNWVAE